MKETSCIWLKEKCPAGKCGGDLYLEQDAWGRFKKKCLLCSREFELTKKQERDLKGITRWR
jgi:hypothetical protein